LYREMERGFVGEEVESILTTRNDKCHCVLLDRAAV
jgi:hypothetical protein